MPEPIKVGSEIEFLSASALLLTGERFTTRSPAVFAHRILKAYKKPVPGEIPGREGFIRIGYQSVIFEMKPVTGEPFTLTVQPYKCYDKWPEYGGPAIIGNPDMYMYNGAEWQIPAVTLPGHTGKELGETMKILSLGRACVLIEIRHTPMGPNAYTECAALILEPAKGIIGKGTVHLFRNSARGDTWSWLYELEGGNTEHGRDDHVGDFGTLTPSYGL